MSAFDFILLFRFYDLLRLQEEIKMRLRLREKLGDYLDLIELIGILFLSTHFVACAWHYIAIYEIEVGDALTWLGPDPDILTEWYNRYIDSVYFSIVTMSTLGYGDIVAKTPSN